MHIRILYHSNTAQDAGQFVKPLGSPLVLAADIISNDPRQTFDTYTREVQQEGAYIEDMHKRQLWIPLHQILSITDLES